MATTDDHDIDETPAAYLTTHAQRLAAKVNRNPGRSLADARYRAVAQWADGGENAELAMQARLSGAFVNVREYGATGDGTTDDTVAIQAAIDALEDLGGGTLFVPRGVHIFTTLALRTGVSLLGGPGSVLRIRDNVSDQNDNIAYYFVRANDVDDIEVRGITFDGNRDENRPVSEGGSWVADIMTITGDRIRVIDCTFLDAPDSALMFAQCTNSEVRGCYFDNSPDLGIYYNDTSGGAATNNLIADNRFTRCQYGAIGIKRNASEVVVSGNTIRDCGNGITVEDFGSGNHPLRVSILGNRLSYIGFNYPNAARLGITVQAAHGSIVSDNLIDDVYGIGISLDGCDDVVCSNNVVRCTSSGSSSTNRGILLAPRNSQGCQRCIVTGNVVTGARAEGFRALTGTGDHVHNRIANNSFASVASDGFRVDPNFLNNDVDGNRFSGEVTTFFDQNANISAGTAVSNRWRDNRLANARRNGFVDVQTASITDDAGPMDQAIGLAAPTVGTWKRGSIVWNYQPAGDAAMCWVCTAAGTPGTWLAIKGVPGSGALTLLGNLLLSTVGQVIILGDGVTSGNVTLRSAKADANNISWLDIQSGGTTQWTGQHDTSENFNILNSAAAVAFQLQRTGSYVRGGTGFRVGAAAGPLITAGAGAPSASDPDGSIYLRTDGAAGTTIYVRAAGAWSANA